MANRQKATVQVRVKVLNFDPEKERISLGLKQLEAYPWEGVEDKYKVGDRVKVLVEEGDQVVRDDLHPARAVDGALKPEHGRQWRQQRQHREVGRGNDSPASFQHGSSRSRKTSLRTGRTVAGSVPV